MSHTPYRNELDGLRGISIFLVVFYHLGINFFHSGFIGVDIFFVISGYLITNLIINKEFKISKFYEGRIRRLLPALLFMLIIVSPIIFFISNDQNFLKEFSKSIFSVIFIFSNFYFNNKNNYFDEESQLNPLLHTWSLSIEWQFYLIFPFIFLFLFKIFKRKIILFFFFIIVLNVALIQLGGNLKTNYPFFEKDFFYFRESVYFNFFSPLSRIWEFLIGAICSIAIYYRTEFKINNFLLFLGYLLIFISLFLIDELNFYPNIFTVLPVAGTSLVILYENKDSFYYKLIASKFLVFFGKISYSWYIWHLPILVIFKLIFFELDYISLFLILLLSIIISFFSWKYIENPFRNKKKFDTKKIYSLNIVFLFFALIISYFINTNETKKEPLDKILASYNFGKSFEEIYFNKSVELKKRKIILDKFRNEIFSDKTKKNLLIVGDSHADSLALVLNYNNQIKKSYNISLFNIGTYQFYRNNIDDNKKKVKFFNSKIFKESDLIILSDRIYPYKTSDELNWSIKGIKELVKISLSLDKKILLSDLSPVFVGNHDPIKSLFLRSVFQEKNLSDKNIKQKIYQLIPKNFFITNGKIKNLEKNSDLVLFELFELLCKKIEKECLYQTDKNELIYFDSNHITLNGAKFLSTKIDLKKFY